MSNVGYTPGAGKTVATDTISAVEYQRVKMVVGSTGKTSDIRAATPGASNASTAAATIASSSGIFLGVSFYSTAASGGCGVMIRDSTSSSTGTILWGCGISTGVATQPRWANEWFGPQGVKIASGLRIVRYGAAKSSVTLYYVSPTPA